MASKYLKETVQSYENYIEENGIDESVIDAYIEAAGVAINTEKDIQYGLQLTKRAKDFVGRFCMVKTGGTIWELEKYAFENKVEYDLIDKYYPTDILDFVGVSNSELEHPTQKPVELLEYLIKTYTNENETVLDNCMGSGSTGVACVNTSRDFIGIELDKDYFNIAKQRITGNQK